MLKLQANRSLPERLLTAINRHTTESCAIENVTYATAATRQDEADTDSNDDEATPRDPEEKNAAAPAGRDTVSEALSTALSTAEVQDNAYNYRSTNDLNIQVKKTVRTMTGVAFIKAYMHRRRSVGDEGTPSSTL